MSVTSTRSIVITLAGDVDANLAYDAENNADAPGDIDILTLSSGANTVTLPLISNIIVSGATIIPPSDNDQTLTLKGVTGDTGIAISMVDPTSIAFNTTTPPVSFVLTAGGTIVGLRVVWT